MNGKIVFNLKNEFRKIAYEEGSDKISFYVDVNLKMNSVNIKNMNTKQLLST